MTEQKIGLTLSQRDWVRKLFIGYFPNVYFPLNSSYYFFELLGKHLRFSSKEKPLVLPEHLQFSGEIGLDVPEMLGEKPFSNLIDKGYKTELMERARKEVFDVFEHISRKEEECFHKGFKEKYKSSGNYNEFIPYLFLIENYEPEEDDDSSEKNKRIFTEYDFYKKCFIWNFYNLLSLPHTPDNICNAIREFAHKVYNLRAFGVWQKRDELYYMPLRNCFFEFLGEKVPVYHELLHQSYPVFTNDKPNSHEFTKKVVENDILGFQFFDVVEELLERKIGSENIYIPSDPYDLVESITEQCGKGLLIERDKKSDLHAVSLKEKIFIPRKEKDRIRNKFKQVYTYVSSKFLSPKSRDSMEFASSGKIYDKIDALYELYLNPDNTSFMRILRIKDIFTTEFKQELARYHSREELSTDQPIGNSEESNITILDIKTESVTVEDENKMTPLERLKIDEAAISLEKLIREQFSESKEELVDEILDDIINILIKFRRIPYSNIVNFMEKRFNYYGSKELYEKYLLKGALVDNEDAFREKLKNIFNEFKDNVKELFYEETYIC